MVKFITHALSTITTSSTRLRRLHSSTAHSSTALNPPNIDAMTIIASGGCDSCGAGREPVGLDDGVQVLPSPGSSIGPAGCGDVGNAVGATCGVLVSTGTADGPAPLGCWMGTDVGVIRGRAVAGIMGFDEGVREGAMEGCRVGTCEGLGNGLGESAPEGSAVGASVN